MTATPIPNINIGDKIIATSRQRDAQGRPVVNSVQGIVTQSEDGLQIVTAQGYRFALEGWSEYKKVPAKK